MNETKELVDEWYRTLDELWDVTNKIKLNSKNENEI